MTENTTNFNQPEDSLKSTSETTVSTKNKFSKYPDAHRIKKPTKVDSIIENLNALGHYAKALEEGTAKIRNTHQTALVIIYDVVFKDCPTFKEEEIDETNYQEYGKIIGKYYMKNDVVCRMIPIEDGWKLDKAEQATYTEVITNEKGETKNQEIKGLNIKFKFEGIIPDSDYPVIYEVNARNGQEGLMKLKNHLYSLKKKIIV